MCFLLGVFWFHFFHMLVFNPLCLHFCVCRNINIQFHFLGMISIFLVALVEEITLSQFLLKISWMYRHGFISVFFILFHWFKCLLFMRVLSCLNYYSFLIYFEIRCILHLALLFLMKMYLAMLVFCDSMWILISFFLFLQKNDIEILLRIALNL